MWLRFVMARLVWTAKPPGLVGKRGSWAEAAAERQPPRRCPVALRRTLQISWVANLRNPRFHAGNAEKRRGGDSNPRYSYPHTGFRNQLLQPLGHLSCWILPKWLPKLRVWRARRAAFRSVFGLMARPRKYVRVIEKADGTFVHVESGGREVHGLSFNRSSRSYYSIKTESGNRVCHGTDITGPWVHSSNSNPTPTITTGRVERQNRRPGRGLVTHARAVSGAPAKQELSDCLAEWTKWKRADHCKEREWIQPVQQRFRRFIKCIGNIPISKSTHETPSNGSLGSQTTNTSNAPRTTGPHTAAIPREHRATRSRRRTSVHHCAVSMPDPETPARAAVITAGVVRAISILSVCLAPTRNVWSPLISSCATSITNVPTAPGDPR